MRSHPCTKASERLLEKRPTLLGLVTLLIGSCRIKWVLLSGLEVLSTKAEPLHLRELPLFVTSGFYDQGFCALVLCEYPLWQLLLKL
jgi:hypothetical protein